MRFLPTRLLTAALVVSGASVTGAQESIRLETGARVRLTSPALPAEARVVRIVATSADSVVFRSGRDAATRSLALTDISAVDVSLGQRRQTRNGAVIGLATGIAIGASLGYATFEECSGWCFFGPNTAGDAAVWGGTAGGVLGLVAGTTLGFLTKTEKWQRVQPNTRITVARLRDASGLSFSYVF